MNTDEEILVELQKLNKKIDNYTNPFKFSWSKFWGGTFSSLGAIFGTVVIASVVVYLFSKFNVTQSFSKWIENTMSQVNWTKVTTSQTFQEK
jgi:hypothetical protein